jgi:hypothetical protein
MTEFPYVWIGGAESAFDPEGKDNCRFCKGKMLRCSIARIAWLKTREN